MNRILIILPFLMFAVYTTSFAQQHLSAYNNYMNQFTIFHDGQETVVEFTPARAYSAGGNAVAYIDQIGNFHIYYDGKSRLIRGNQVPTYMEATDNFVLYRISGKLGVFDHGEEVLLTYLPGEFVAGDSIIAFEDLNTLSFKVYYDHKIHELEAVTGGDVIQDFKVGDNIVAFINRDLFKVFYKGKVTELANEPPLSYKVGENIVAYVDRYTQTLKVFYKGEIYEISGFLPRTYDAGDNMVAFVDNSGRFNLFRNNETREIDSFEPSYFEVIDKMIIYSNNSGLNIYLNDSNKNLENYVPEDIQADESNLAYVDINGRLKMYSNNQLIEVTNESISSFTLNRSLLKYDLGFGRVRFFLNGKHY